VTNPAPGGGPSNSANFMVRNPASPVYVIDYWNHRVEIFDSNGNYLSQFDHSFDLPMGITTDCQHNIYVQDGNLNYWLDKFDSSANFLWQVNGSTGPGVFDNVSMITADSAGNVWIASPDFFYVQKYDSSANFQSMFCTASPSVTGLNNCPMVTPFDVQGESIALDAVGNIWLVNENSGIAPPLIKFDGTGKYLAAFESWGSGNGQFNANISSTPKATST
jgi:hypothetical protein